MTHIRDAFRPSTLLLELQSGITAPFLFLILSRVILTALALAAVNYFPHASTLYNQELIKIDLHTLPGVWLRYDAGYYVEIARNGYSRFGQDTNFFPFFPLLIRSFLFGDYSMVAGTWAGWALSNVAYLSAALLLWTMVEEQWGRPAAWAVLITLNIYPTAFFFSAVYTESVFLLLSVLVWWLARKRMYTHAAVAVSLACLTRINGVVLALIPLIEIWMQNPPAKWRKLIQTAAVSGLGMIIFLAYNWIARGSPFAFIMAQSATMGRSLAFPWTTLIDSLNVTLTGAGGNVDNWFMRLITLHDLVNILLFLGLTYFAFRWLPRSLAWYNLVGLVFMLVSHGPNMFGVFSGSRYVLIFFPGFIALGLLLSRYKRLRWATWTAFTLWLLFLLAWWVSGHWVA